MSSTPATSDRLSRASSSSSGPPDHGSAGTPELFVYGTLTLDDVVRALLDRVPDAQPSRAPGWRVATLPDLPYPGLVADSTATAVGRVHVDLTEPEWTLLDSFEDSIYHLQSITLDGGRRSYAYVWPAPSLDGTWTAAELDGEAMSSYLARCRAWRERYDRAHTLWTPSAGSTVRRYTAV